MMSNVAVGCQGGGSHTAFSAGVLDVLLESQQGEDYRISGLSGTSGGAICALLAWYGLLEGGERAARSVLASFWDDNATASLPERIWNELGVRAAKSPLELRLTPYAPR